MIVMMMAITPSLKVSSLALVMTYGLTAFNLRQNKPESNHQHAANQCCSMSAVAVALLPNGVISLNVFRYWHSHREVSLPITNKSPPLRLCTPMNEVEAVVKSRF